VKHRKEIYSRKEDNEEMGNGEEYCRNKSEKGRVK
jgi:hypothetical protein